MMNDYEKLEYIIETFETDTGLKRKAFFSKSRKRELVEIRQLIHYFAKRFTKLSLSQIGNNAGNMNHATILHGDRVIKNILSYDISMQVLTHEFDKKFDDKFNNKKVSPPTIVLREQIKRAIIGKCISEASCNAAIDEIIKILEENKHL